MSKNYKPLTDIHLKIRYLREHLVVDQCAIAKYMGISQRAYSKIESNQTNLHVWHLHAITGFYAISMADFFSQSDHELLSRVLIHWEKRKAG